MQFGRFSFDSQEVRAGLLLLSIIIVILILWRRLRLRFSVVVLLTAVGLAGCSIFAQQPSLAAIADVKCIGTAVVIGASRGIGATAAKELAARGCRVVAAGRDPARLQSVVDSIRAAVPSAEVVVGEVDLMSLKSVDAFAAQLTATYESLEVLILNAALLGQYPLTEDGFESVFQVNHLSQFRLTQALLPLLQKARQRPRVVAVSSMGAVMGSERKSWQQEATTLSTDANAAFIRYCITKYANILFVAGLQQRYGDWLTSMAVHPGFVMTGLYREFLSERALAILQQLSLVVAKSDTTGAHTMLLAALDPVRGAKDSGHFLSSTGERFDYPEVIDRSQSAIDELWVFSEQAMKQR